ncbi:hypothetical protein CHARACLAT_020171 [Characodon lateralis]|uniref:Uncharacterized protein n=1 Tax=Characodon lateralis TaxID=208331 RepID=A0ABU7DBB2_9TELE|nr:hypothetical protein [Characodon lateralis]
MTVGKPFSPHIYSAGDLSCAHIVSPFKRRVKAFAACLSHFLKKVLLDDTWWQCPVSEEMVKELVVRGADELRLTPLKKKPTAAGSSHYWTIYRLGIEGVTRKCIE